jgi:flagellar biosynthetic protein FlhB
MMAALVAIAIAINLSQTGFLWSVEALAPKPSKINPVQGLQRMISKRSLVELAKSIAKIIIIGWAAYSTLKGSFMKIIPFMYQDKGIILPLMGQESLRLVIKCFWVIALLAILDFFYQRWEYEENLKMTKQEVKDEFKQTEGDPQVKGRIRSVQMEMARKRMMEEVPKADVIITNPTRLAIAIRYDPLTMTAPLIVAKGAKKLAARIREVAREHDIPLVENRPLAQNLYKLDIGAEIPSQFYQAVAEILAYVYSLKKKPIEQG